MMIKENDEIRLNKYLAMAGIASRRKCDELIESGIVKVNGRTVTELGTKVTERDTVTVKGKIINVKEKRIYILLNKPNDYITTVKDEKDRKTVMDIVKVKERVFPIGRLDRKTTGVLLLTNDGDLANRLMHPRHMVIKEYKVTLDKSVKRDTLKKIFEGVELEDGIAKAAEVYNGKANEVFISVHEGRNHLVRRIFEKLGFTVEKLDRIRYAGFSYEGLARGEWRQLRSSEVLKLKELLQMVEK
jgi:23S rRNA pseudouridine2605 synthase